MRLAVRAAHVLAMTLLVGGPLLVVALALRRSAAPALLGVASAFEYLFWGAIGVAVATGVGNLGALAPDVPPTSSAWGAWFYLKLLAVLALLVLSAYRTLLVAHARASPEADPRIALLVAYGATLLLGGGIAGVAVRLAHG